MTVKRKTLFDHLNAIYIDQSVGYYDRLSVDDKKTYDTFMINRFISMNMDYVEIVNELQKHWDAIKDRESYLFYSQLLPNGKQWNQYIKAKKGEKEKKCEGWILELLARHYLVSQREARMYFETFMNTPEGQASLIELFEDYGVEPKKIKKVVRVSAVPKVTNAVKPRARNTDPKTSHVAAKSVQSLAESQRGKVMELLESHGPMNADEVDELAGWRITTAGRRLPELHELGLVEPTGDERPTRSNRQARVYRICP